MDGSKPEVGVAPALGISMNVQVDGNRQLVFQTHVGRDDPPQVLHAALDTIAKAADRQVARYMLVSLRKELARHKKALADQIEDTERVNADNKARWEEGGRKGPYKLDAKEKAALANILISKQKYQKEIADIEQQITDTEAKVADLG